MSEPIWNQFLTERDKAVFAASGYGARGGFGYSRAYGTFSASASVRTDATYQSLLELDREVKAKDDELEKAKKSQLPLFAGAYGELANEVFQMLVEVAEVTERVDNSIKVVGDYYLSRVYQAAVQRLRLAEWEESLDNKLELVRETYDMLKKGFEDMATMFAKGFADLTKAVSEGNKTVADRVSAVEASVKKSEAVLKGTVAGEAAGDDEGAGTVRKSGSRVPPLLDTGMNRSK